MQASVQQDTLEVLRPSEEHPNALIVSLSLLDTYHYRKIELNDSLSQVIFDNYVSALDPTKSFFLKSEIEDFSGKKYELDDQLKSADLSFGYELFERYREKAIARYKMIPELLEKEFDFSKEEYIETDYESKDWTNSASELRERWRKILKNQSLSYKLNNKEWPEIQDALGKRYEQSLKSLHQYNSEDVFQIYLNAVTSAYDPHTSYFSPIAKDNFEIQMSLSLEGIGAQLTKQLDYVVIADIVPGGPAFKSKQLQKDDKILAVGQGDDGSFEDVIGWRLDDVVQLIRGPKGSIVRLVVNKQGSKIGGVPDTVTLVRDKIKLEEQAAQSEMIPISDGNATFNLGVVTIPSFYIDFEEMRQGKKDYKSTTRDVKKLIEELEEQGMDGLLIDLRYNGGGSLQEAIDLTGLFIPEGPVVQVRNTDLSVDPLFDEDYGKTYYEGPLAVLTNRFSASASEIFSGAIQDYRRGLIVGENTFGKGTVQNLIDLDKPIINYLSSLASQNRKNEDAYTQIMSMRKRIMGGDLKLGQLKMTLAKFYRATGSSTQRRGVEPDIAFPSIFEADEYGESSRDNALPWDEIDGKPFEPTDNISEALKDKLYQVYLQDLASDPDLQKLVADIEKVNEGRDDTRLSLNLESRKATADESQEDKDLSTTVDISEVNFTEDEETMKKLSEDPYLKESLKLLSELVKIKS